MQQIERILYKVNVVRNKLLEKCAYFTIGKEIIYKAIALICPWNNMERM